MGSGITRSHPNRNTDLLKLFLNSSLKSIHMIQLPLVLASQETFRARKVLIVLFQAENAQCFSSLVNVFSAVLLRRLALLSFSLFTDTGSHIETPFFLPQMRNVI